jgi:hypothetical protein
VDCRRAGSPSQRLPHARFIRNRPVRRPSGVDLQLAGQDGVVGVVRGAHHERAQRTELGLDRVGPGRVGRGETQLDLVPGRPGPDGGGLVRRHRPQASATAFIGGPFRRRSSPPSTGPAASPARWASARVRRASGCMFSCSPSLRNVGRGSDSRYSRTARSRSSSGYFRGAGNRAFLPGSQDRTSLQRLRRTGGTSARRDSE